jgi:hypothetical protein
MPQTLRHLVGELAAPLPLGQWSLLIAVAVGGSCLYGASLSLLFSGWSGSGSAAWLAISAGLAWCVFIPCLSAFTRVPLVTCWHCCLVAMGGGEVVLVSGALVNVVLLLRTAVAYSVEINAGIVLVSNIAMSALLALQLRRHGVAIAKTLVAWMLILNGTGAIFFPSLYLLFHES